VSRRAVPWLVAVVLVALNLRPAVASVPPIVGEVRGALGLSTAAAGALTALPVVCMGLFAPVAAVVAVRWGTTRTLAAALALLAAAVVVRPLGGSALLFAGTVLAGVGIAVGSALLPALARARFPDRVGPVTGVYTIALIGGALLAAGGTEPLRAALFGSWRWALALWAVPAVVALVGWLAVRPAVAPAVSPGDPRPSPHRSRRRRGGWSPWRDRTAWSATVYMGGQSLLYYVPLAWLAARYTELGWSAREAGGLLALFSATQLVSALALPAIARPDPRPGIAGAVGLTAACLGVIAVAPLAAPALWAALLGLGVGGNFALALTVVGTVAPAPGDTARASGMAFFVGYLLASVGPVAVGLAHDATGDFRWPFLGLVAVGAVTLAAGLAAGVPRRPPP
jgi:CP family cyanate transporter-like MFS transporter